MDGPTCKTIIIVLGGNSAIHLSSQDIYRAYSLAKERAVIIGEFSDPENNEFITICKKKFEIYDDFDSEKDKKGNSNQCILDKKIVNGIMKRTKKQ